MFDTFSVHFAVFFCSSHSVLEQTALMALRKVHTDDIVSQSVIVAGLVDNHAADPAPAKRELQGWPHGKSVGQSGPTL